MLILHPIFTVDGGGCLFLMHSFRVNPELRIAEFGLKKLHVYNDVMHISLS